MGKETKKPSKDFKKLVKAYSRYYKVNYTEALRSLQAGADFATHAVDAQLKTVRTALKDAQAHVEELAALPPKKGKKVVKDVQTLLENLQKEPCFTHVSKEVEEPTAKNLTLEEAVRELSPELFGKSTVVLGRPGSGKTYFVRSLLQQLNSKTRVLVVGTDGWYKLPGVKVFPTQAAALEELARLKTLKSDPQAVLVVENCDGRPLEVAANHAFISTRQQEESGVSFDNVVRALWDSSRKHEYTVDLLRPES